MSVSMEQPVEDKLHGLTGPDTDEGYGSFKNSIGNSFHTKSKKIVDVWSFLVENNGGVLKIPEEGMTLVVPRESLPEGHNKIVIKLGIIRSMSSEFEEVTESIALSPTIVLEPHGLVFRKPVYLFLPTYAFPRLCRFPSTKIVCRETDNVGAVKWQQQDEDGDKTLLAIYPKHVVVKMMHFCQFTFAANGQERPHTYATVLLFASHHHDSESITIGIFVVGRNRVEEAVATGNRIYDVPLAQDDMAVFTDVTLDHRIVIINLYDIPGTCATSDGSNQPQHVKSDMQIPLSDISGDSVRHVTMMIPTRNLGALLRFRLRVRQPRGLDRFMGVSTDISRIRQRVSRNNHPASVVSSSSPNRSRSESLALLPPDNPGPSSQMTVVDSVSPVTDDGTISRPIECLSISPELRSRLSAVITPDERRTMSVALALRDEVVTPNDDILLLWEGVHGGPMLHELANVFRVSNPGSVAAAIVDEWLQNSHQ